MRYDQQGSGICSYSGPFEPLAQTASFLTQASDMPPQAELVRGECIPILHSGVQSLDRAVANSNVMSVRHFNPVHDITLA